MYPKLKFSSWDNNLLQSRSTYAPISCVHTFQIMKLLLTYLLWITPICML